MQRLAAVCVLALLPACAGTKNYLDDRVKDLTDVVRLHLIVGNAIGAEVQVTEWIGLGFMYEDDAWAGGWGNRKLTSWDETIRGWGLIIHDWKETTQGITRYSGSYGWFQTAHVGGPSFSRNGAPLDFLKVRASVALIFGADVEVRIGEAFDFVVGIFTWDPAGDDGM